MVSVNVAQLLQEGPGAVRDFDFAERLPDPDNDLHMRGPIRGRAHLTRTSRGILVHADHAAMVELECARCLSDVRLRVVGSFDEEFLPTTDIRTGVPVDEEPEERDHLRIDEHHEINLDEVLRQTMLTNMPLRPLCETMCPGLCPTCGGRLDNQHPTHAEPTPQAVGPDKISPFARLADLLSDDGERTN